MNKEFFLFLIDNQYLNLKQLIIDNNKINNLFSKNELNFIFKLNNVFDLTKPIFKKQLINKLDLSVDEINFYLTNLKKIKIIKTINLDLFTFNFSFILDFINLNSQFRLENNHKIIYSNFFINKQDINNQDNFQLNSNNQQTNFINEIKNRIKETNFKFEEFKINILNSVKDFLNFKPNLNFEINYLDFLNDLKKLQQILKKTLTQYNNTFKKHEILQHDFQQYNKIIANLKLLIENSSLKFQNYLLDIKKDFNLEKKNFLNLISINLQEDNSAKNNLISEQIFNFFYQNRFQKKIFRHYQNNSNFNTINSRIKAKIEKKLINFINKHWKNYWTKKNIQNLLKEAINFWIAVYY